MYTYWNMAAPMKFIQTSSKTSKMTVFSQILPQFLAYYDASKYWFDGNDDWLLFLGQELICDCNYILCIFKNNIYQPYHFDANVFYSFLDLQFKYKKKIYILKNI